MTPTQKENTMSQNQCCDTNDQTCCPIEKTVSCWSGSFMDAMKAVQLDILKDKIRKAWGAQMEKVGDAVIEAMGVEWQSMLAKGKSQLDLRETIKKIFLSQK